MYRNRIIHRCLLFILVTLTAAPLFAENEAESAAANEPGYHTHDGLFLRLLGGFGYLNSNYEESDLISGFTCSGPGFNASIQVGASISPDISLFYKTSIINQKNPKLEQDGMTYSTSGLTNRLKTDGLGANYHFTPSNTYLSLSLDLARITADTDEGSGSSEIGYGFTFTAGQERWVSADWGIGLAAILSYSRMKDEGLPNHISNYFFGIALTATYN